MPHKAPPNPRFTHFLSFPLRSPNFTNAAAAFGTALLTAQPPITGMHPSIVMAPVRLHLTIGLMSLVKERKLRDHHNRNGPDVDEQDDVSHLATKTIREAIERFETCRAVVDRVTDLRETKSLEVSFDKLATFQTKLDSCQVSTLDTYRSTGTLVVIMVQTNVPRCCMLNPPAKLSFCTPWLVRSLC
jgi:hypothetical protein